MSRHLSAEQIDAVILGETSPATEEHLRHCADCQEELARLTVAFTSFRDSVHRLASREHTYPRTPDPAHRWAAFSRLSLAVVAMAVCVLLVILVSQRPSQQSRAQAASDAALLSEIDAEVSRTVPSTMEPLTEFVPNDRSAANGKARP